MVVDADADVGGTRLWLLSSWSMGLWYKIVELMILSEVEVEKNKLGLGAVVESESRDRTDVDSSDSRPRWCASLGCRE